MLEGREFVTHDSFCQHVVLLRYFSYACMLQNSADLVFVWLCMFCSILETKLGNDDSFCNILDFDYKHLFFKDRDTQKIQWIDRFIEELRTNDKWVIPALKQIREICSLFGEAPQNLR